MRRALAIIVLLVHFAGLAAATQGRDNEVIIGGQIAKPGRYPLVAKESLAELLNRVGGIPVTQAALKRYQAGQSPHVGVKLLRDGKVQQYHIDPKSSALWDIKVQNLDTVEISVADLGFDPADATLKLSRPAAHHD
jgi:hypothetical protein